MSYAFVRLSQLLLAVVFTYKASASLEVTVAVFFGLLAVLPIGREAR